VLQIQKVYRGHCVRRDVARLRPTSASTSASLTEPLEEVPEEIVMDEEDECLGTLSALTLGRSTTPPLIDGALEVSGELPLESSADATNVDRICAICLGPMLRLREAQQPLLHSSSGRSSSSSADVPLSVTTLECSHRFHRRCLLGWCRQKPPGLCPCCRAVVRVRKSRKEEVMASALEVVEVMHGM